MRTTCLGALLLGLMCLTTLPAAHALDWFQSDAEKAARARYAEGKALFDERCQNVAGIKIYKTVGDVEGIVLLKLRPVAGDREWADPMWPGAAFAVESTGESYINTLLWFETPAGNPKDSKPEPITAENRGFLQPTPSDHPGYRYVDVVDEGTGKRERYSGAMRVDGKKDITAPNVQNNLRLNPNYDLNIYRWKLEHQPAPAEGPRYGVTFEDYVIPEERALGLASSTVRVLDLKTNEVLGEMTVYAWTPGKPSAANPSPWLTAYRCGAGFGRSNVTRLFVDQVLQPRKEK